MISFRYLFLATALGVAVLFSPSSSAAQSSSGFNSRFAYNQGFERGRLAGLDADRHGNAYRFDNLDDYKRGDYGYRSEYGTRDRYRSDFRLGFEDGYRVGYAGYGNGNGRGQGGPPPWSNGRARGVGRGRAVGRYDPASQAGYNDGYDAGIRDAQGRRQFDPISEGRYRSGDHGYDRKYGSRDAYKLQYRDAFRSGYEEGFNDVRRYYGR
jgi:hypothetical protein